MAHFPSVGPRSPSSGFNYPPPGYSHPPSYPSGPMNTFNPSYPGIGSPMIPVPSIGPSLPTSFQAITPPPSFSFVPPSRTPSFSPPSFRPPPSFDSSSLPGRIERFNPPSIPQGLTPSWAAAPSLPPHLSPSYPSISSLTGSSPSVYSLNPPSFHSPAPLTFSIPSSSFSLPPTLSPSSVRVPSFSQPPSLSGRAYISPFTPSSPGILLPRNQEVTVWAQTPSFPRSPFPSDTSLKGLRSSSFSFPHRPVFLPVEDHKQFQNSIRRQLEETKKIMSLMDAGPERPFPVWGTVGVSQFVVQINPQTTLFIDPLAVTEFFQRTSEARGWAVQSQPIRRNPLALGSSTQSATNDQTATQGGPGIFHQFLERTAEMQARDVHAVVKYTGIFIKNTLGWIEEAYPLMALINYPVGAGMKQLKDWGVKGALENKTVPYLHEKVDQAYKTNYTANFDPKKDGPLERFVQDLVFDPMNLVFMGMGSSVKVVVLAESAVKIGTRIAIPETIGKFAMTRVPRIGTGVGIEEIVKGRQITSFARDLGYSGSEIVRLQQAGRLSETIASAFENIVKIPAKRESFELFNKAQEFLQPYSKQFMIEAQCRELIHVAGVRTFPRPIGIPENFRIKISNTGAGLKYVHPWNEQTYVRVMPGRAHAKYPHQQNTYVVQMKDGKTLNNLGKVVKYDSPEAHIPLGEFVYFE